MLLLASVWPEPSSSAAGLRDFGLIHALKRHGVSVTVASAGRNPKGLAETQALGVPCHEIELNDSTFDEWVRELKPDIVVFDRFMVEEQFGARVRRAVPKALRILDTIDLHSLRNFRKKAPPFSKQIAPIHEELLRELASIHRSDWTWMVSNYETQLLTTHFQVRAEQVSTVRFFYDKPPLGLSFEDRKDFCWIGNFRHTPNYDSVFFLTNEIWPKIRSKLPESRLHIYGAYPPDEVMRLQSEKNGIRVGGEVLDAKDAFAPARVSLAPLRYGAGIKGKISDSWYFGTPVITTSVGSEGMTDQPDFAGLVVDDPTLFAEYACQIYSNPTLWSSLQKRGYETLQKEYSHAQADRLVADTLEKLDKIDAIRQNNIVGEILWLNTLRSTEYFSRWIEAKNKKPSS